MDIVKMDNLGRVTIPEWLREKLMLNPNDLIAIYPQSDYMVIMKSTQNCVFCNADKGLTYFKGRYICVECRDKIAKGEPR